MRPVDSEFAQSVPTIRFIVSPQSRVQAADTTAASNTDGQQQRLPM
jgi:hypothetical protein